MTAGTTFDRTRTPLTVWFIACWLFAMQNDGVSALSLQRHWRSAAPRKPEAPWRAPASYEPFPAWCSWPVGRPPPAV